MPTKKTFPKPKVVVKEIDYSNEALASLLDPLQNGELSAETRELIAEYPTVYVISSEEGQKTSFRSYVGETNNIVQRTKTHLVSDPRSASQSQREKWTYFRESKSSRLHIIGHNYFNKSLTLDIEDKMMLYLTSSESSHSVDSDLRESANARRNSQGKYFTSNFVDEIFSQIWRQLNLLDSDLFPAEKIIRDSALFKASPFHRLTQEQLEAKALILNAIENKLTDTAPSEEGNLIFVEGAAGTGKTVLLSSIFFELAQGSAFESNQIELQNLDCYLLCNHHEQLRVYEEISEKLGISRKDEERVLRPTRFINKHSSEDKVDVVLVDEGHLLLTQGDQGYKGKNHLKDLLERARLVICIFDPLQILNRKGYVTTSQIDEIRHSANTTRIELSQQMRVSSLKATNWIRSFVDEGQITEFPDDYDLRVFDDPQELYSSISEKASEVEHGLSRLLATYDWEWKSKKPEDGGTWDVVIGDFRMPWNYALKPERTLSKSAWAEQPQTINEVGSTFTIQGFDLNYAGVILGESVKWDESTQRVITDKSKSFNKNATSKRTIGDTTVDVSDELLRNELNVLLTRGVHGLYIYAVDPALRAKLLEFQAQSTLGS